MISIRRTCSLFARAYPKATLLAPTPDTRPAFTRNYSGAEVQLGALDRLVARIASIEPKGSRFLTGWTLSIPALALPDDRLSLLQRDVGREHLGLTPQRGEAGTKGDGWLERAFHAAISPAKCERECDWSCRASEKSQY